MPANTGHRPTVIRQQFGKGQGRGLTTHGRGIIHRRKGAVGSVGGSAGGVGGCRFRYGDIDNTLSESLHCSQSYKRTEFRH